MNGWFSAWRWGGGLALWVASFALWSACGGSPSSGNNNNGNGTVYQNNIFTQTQRFSASMTMSDPGKPSFSWAASGRKHVVCMIFSEQIQVKLNRITNQDKVVWMWHTGLGTGREGNISYEHGVPEEGKSGPVPPLAKGTYYWGVWIINDQGRPILSTIEYKLEIP